MSPAACVVVLTTWPTTDDPEVFARRLVEEGLAACVNVHGEMQSVFRWEGRVDASAERQLVIKTTSERVPQLLHHLKANHPYDLPEFLVLPVIDGSKDYLAWVAASTE